MIMKYNRKYKIPVIIWFCLSVMYLDTLFVVSIWVLLNIISIIKSKIFEIPIEKIWEYVSDGNYYILWVALPIFIGYSLSLLKSAVTNIEIKNETKEIIFTYQSVISLFLKEKSITIPFDNLDYYIDRGNHSLINKVLLPFIPTVVTVFYKENRYLLQFGCTIGWTHRQYNKIIENLIEIKLPNKSKKEW